MTIHFFTKGDIRTASSRQRAFLVAEELAKRGVNTTVCTPAINEISEAPWPQKGTLILAAYRNLKKVGRKDVIFLQRAFQNKYFFAALIFYKICLRRKLILDLDDAVYLHTPLKTKVLTYLANAVIVGSHSIKKWAQKYNQNVYLVPTSVPISAYEKISSRRHEQNVKFTLGWIGNGPAHYENLCMLVPIFSDLVKQGLDFKFQLIGALGDRKIYQLFDSIEDMQVEIIDSLDWGDPESVPRAIQGFDIGLMPLVDSEWNEGKCAFKAIEYMACAVPPILSPVGENKFLVKDAMNGFIPNSLQEWINDILKLYADEKLRFTIGNAAQATVRKCYSLEENMSLLKTILITL